MIVSEKILPEEKTLDQIYRELTIATNESIRQSIDQNHKKTIDGK